jgi:hypothetical protein
MLERLPGPEVGSNRECRDQLGGAYRLLDTVAAPGTEDRTRHLRQRSPFTDTILADGEWR